jgi:hypothetical protein
MGISGRTWKLDILCWTFNILYSHSIQPLPFYGYSPMFPKLPEFFVP